jgi:hypothetical protein
MSGESPGLIQTSSGNFSYSLIIIATLVWFGFFYFLTVSHLWNQVEIVVVGVLSAAALYFLLQSASHVVRTLISRTKSCLLITPIYVIDIRFDDVWFWDWEQLSTVDSSHSYENGSYEFTQIALRLNGVTKSFKIKDLGAAEELIDQVDQYKKMFIEATVRNDSEYLDSNDDFRELQTSNSPTEKLPTSPLFARIATLAPAVVLTVGIMFGAIVLNEYCDDIRSWNSAQANNRASSYRSYLQRYPKGRWAENARVNLRSIYDEAEQKYRASLNPGHDKNAADAVSEILRYASATQNFRVKVAFERHVDIPQNLEEEIKKDFEVKNVLPLGGSLSVEKMKNRESRLLMLISDAFKQVIPDDILEITSECLEECVDLSVRYDVDPMNSIYYDLRQKDSAENDRVYYPGILIDWEFVIRIPQRSDDYEFSLESLPAREISYDSNSDGSVSANKDFSEVLSSDLGNVYDSMVASAFDDFKANLIFRMGIGEPPKTTTETPSEKER